MWMFCTVIPYFSKKKIDWLRLHWCDYGLLPNFMSRQAVQKYTHNQSPIYPV